MSVLTAAAIGVAVFMLVNLWMRVHKLERDRDDDLR